MDWIAEIISHYNVITKANPLVATLLIPIVGGLMYYLKNAPRALWSLIMRYTTVTMALNNAGYDGNVDAYHAFDRWFMQSGYKRFSRNFFMFRQYNGYKDDVVKAYRLGIGNGVHYFFYSYRFFWFRKGRLESSGSEREKEEIRIFTFGWNHNVFEELVGLFNKKTENKSTITIHTYSQANGSWNEFADVPIRDINTFCMNQDLRNEIIAKLQHFIGNREWYRKKGLTYKTSYLFYGPPGTGKTTLARLLAGNFRRDIYMLDLNALSNTGLVNALSSVKPGSFVLIEDIDQAGGAVRNREKKKGEAVTLMDAMSEMGNMTMSGFLNAFDGVAALDDVIIITTTNHPEDLDPAVRRKSRIDNEYLIDELTQVEVFQYFEQMYDEATEEQHTRALSFLSKNEIRLPGCEVENAFKENPDSPIGFLSVVHSRHMARIPIEEAA
jgi:chaperone BCS1